MGLLVVTLPPWLLAGVYTVLGWTIGLGFTRAILMHAYRALPQVALSIFILMAVCAGLAFVLVRGAGIDPLTAYLATSPGGMDTVAIIAASSNVDVPVRNGAAGRAAGDRADRRAAASPLRGAAHDVRCGDPPQPAVGSARPRTAIAGPQGMIWPATLIPLGAEAIESTFLSSTEPTRMPSRAQPAMPLSHAAKTSRPSASRDRPRRRSSASERRCRSS